MKKGVWISAIIIFLVFGVAFVMFTQNIFQSNDDGADSTRLNTMVEEESIIEDNEVGSEGPTDHEFDDRREYNKGNSDIEKEITENPSVGSQPTDYPPTDLLLPFNILDIDTKNGILNPLGVVRFSTDQSNLGHSGIDIPLKKDAPIYAVANGPIVLIESAGDPWDGKKIVQLIDDTGTGTGWAFIYEHAEVPNHIGVGSVLQKGELIATKVAPQGFTVHLQLSKVFNNYKFTSDPLCWPDYLGGESISKMDAWWNDYKDSSHLVNSWKTTEDEGNFPFKALLDESKFPEGIAYCYPLGTDVR